MSDDAGGPTVPETLRDLHPLVAEAIRCFDRNETDPTGILQGWQSDQLCLAVSPKAFQRAARVADTLFKYLERSGWTVAVRRGHRDGVTVTINGQEVDVRIREVLEQRRVPCPYGESVKWEPTGRLQLVIDEYLDGARRNWADGKKRGKVEDQIERFTLGLRTAAEAKAVQAQDREQERRLWEQRRQHEEAARATRAAQEQKVKDLEAQVQYWHRSQRIRAYLAAVREAAIRKRGAIEVGTELHGWLSWADSYAESIDPLRSLRSTSSS